MFATSSQLDSYRAVQKTTITGRELEASVLTQAALRLTDCQNNWDAPDKDVKLKEALTHNQKVWSIFQESSRDRTIRCRRNCVKTFSALACLLTNGSIEILTASPAAGEARRADQYQSEPRRRTQRVALLTRVPARQAPDHPSGAFFIAVPSFDQLVEKKSQNQAGLREALQEKRARNEEQGLLTGTPQKQGGWARPRNAGKQTF